jgi:cytochrome P450
MTEGATGLGCPFIKGFDPLIPEQVANPWPYLQHARETAPVFYMPGYDQWCVTRHEDVLAVYNDPITFSNQGAHDMRVAIPAALHGEVPADYTFPLTGQLNTVDPPQHTRIRKLMQKAFTARHAVEREPEIRALCNELIDGFVDAGQTDLASTYTTPLPITVISRILGVPPESTGGFQDWADDFFRLTGATDVPDEESIPRWRRIYEWDAFIREFIASRRAEPQTDLVSDLIRAQSEDDGPSLTDEELLANILGIVAAGADTTKVLITHIVYLLLNHRERWEDVRADRSLVPRAVEETMRLMGPVRGIRRTTTAPVRLGGVDVPVGATIYLHVGSASRDGAIFEDPERFDLHRTNTSKHLGFGIWTHFCLGAPLARLEARIALETLLDRLPTVRLAEGQGRLEYTDNMVLPSPRHLHVAWGA